MGRQSNSSQDQACETASGARRALRDETRQAHDRVDAAFGAHDLSTLDGYARFLSAQSRAFVAVERAAEAAGVAGLIEDWPLRRRADLLLEDLAEMGVAAPRTIQAPPMTSEAELLGAVYVLEGSRLGGAVLGRNIPDQAPRRFLGGDGAGPRWRALTALLDARLVAADQIADAVRSARSVFDCFDQAAKDAAAA